MAKTLAEALRGARQQPAPGVAPGAGQTLQKTIQARGGKAVGPGTTPRMSALGEQAAAAQTAAAQRQVAQQGGMQQRQQEIQMEEQEQRAGFAKEQLSLQAREQQQKFTQQAMAIADDLQQSREELATKKGISKLNQAGFMTRLGSEQYVFDLNQEAAKERLDDDLAFQEKMYEVAWGDTMDALRDTYDLNMLIAMNESEFAKEMADMDIETAMKVANTEIETAQKQAIVSGISSGIKGSAEYGAFD